MVHVGVFSGFRSVHIRLERWSLERRVPICAPISHKTILAGGLSQALDAVLVGTKLRRQRCGFAGELKGKCCVLPCTVSVSNVFAVFAELAQDKTSTVVVSRCGDSIGNLPSIASVGILHSDL
jgi:hypothetical protein